MKRNNFYAEAKARPGLEGQRDSAGAGGPRRRGHVHAGAAATSRRMRDTSRNLSRRTGGRDSGGHGDAAERIQLGAEFSELHVDAGGARVRFWVPGPEMKKIDVDVFFGTLERGNVKLLETVMGDKKAGQLVKGVGVQWAGKNALAEIHREYPELPIFRRSRSAAIGTNSWSYTRLLLAADEAIFPARRARRTCTGIMATAKGGHEHVGMASRIRW